MKVRVKFIPFGNRIQYVIRGKVFCTRQQCYIPKARTYNKDDRIWRDIFTQQELRRFLHRNVAITKVVELIDLGYNYCDCVR